MDSFIFKLTNIFDYNGDGSVFQTFKNETLYYLNDKNLRDVDYKSVGSLFGMNYNSESLKKIDIMIEFGYDLYVLRKFLLDLVNFYCNRKILTTKSYIDIIKSYALDENELIKSINKQNEKRKFKIMQKKIWAPLYYMINNNRYKRIISDTDTDIKIKNNNINYELNNSNNKDNNIFNKDNLDENMKTGEEWRSFYKKKKSIKKVNILDTNDNNNIQINNRFKSLDNDEIIQSLSTADNYKNKLTKCDYEEISSVLTNINDSDSDNDSDNIKQLKIEDKKKFENIKIYKKQDLQDEIDYNDRIHKLENSEKNIEKIIEKIKDEIYEKRKKNWADISDSCSDLSI
jgi:hypothetical protein